MNIQGKSVSLYKIYLMRNILIFLLLLVTTACDRDEKTLTKGEGFPHDWNLTLEQVISLANPHGKLFDQKSGGGGKIMLPNGLGYHWETLLEYAPNNGLKSTEYFFNAHNTLCATKITFEEYNPGIKRYRKYYEEIYGPCQQQTHGKLLTNKWVFEDTDLYLVAEKDTDEGLYILYANKAYLTN